MIILKRRGPVRLEFDPGANSGVGGFVVRDRTPETPADVLALTVQPAGEIEFDFARSRCVTAFAQMKEGVDVLARYGAPDMATAGADPRALLRVGTAALSVELGVQQIRSWEGVSFDGETLADLEQVAIATLFNARDAKGISYGRHFLLAMESLSTLEPGSKNGSAASPGTIGAEAGNAAGNAG